jgi:hypothetical protein
MPTYSQGPRLLKGAIVAIDPAGGGRSTIVFQYNPETVKRSLEPQMAGGEGGQRSLAVRYTGAPVETIDLEVTSDAVDQIETGRGCAAPIQLSEPRQRQRPASPTQGTQRRASVCSAPPAARVQPKAGLIRPLLVKPGQTCFESFDGTRKGDSL